MNKSVNDRLFGSANWVMMLGIVGAVIAAQWKHEALPVIALLVVLALTVAKARLIVLDFMALRGSRPRLATALFAWPAFFLAAGLAKAVLPAFV
jgi:hypothetical protein